MTSIAIFGKCGAWLSKNFYFKAISPAQAGDRNSPNRYKIKQRARLRSRVPLISFRRVAKSQPNSTVKQGSLKRRLTSCAVTDHTKPITASLYFPYYRLITRTLQENPRSSLCASRVRDLPCDRLYPSSQPQTVAPALAASQLHRTLMNPSKSPRCGPHGSENVLHPKAALTR